MVKKDKESIKDDFCTRGKDDKCRCNCKNLCGGSNGAIYGLGLIGAAVYFIQHAESFWMGVLGVIKAIFWPALVVYKIFELWRF